MPNPSPGCPFCDLADRDLVWSNDQAVAFRDGFPVSPGHTLVIPRRHVATYFDANAFEQAALWQGVSAVKAQLDTLDPKPDGYNVGFNAGRAAGQTVMHLHIHVIPRYTGDMHDPRGGVRGVIPTKQKYDTTNNDSPSPADSTDPFADLLTFIPGEQPPNHFLPVLEQALQRADAVDIAVAFAQDNDLDRFWGGLEDALARGATVRFLTGDYFHRTSPHALQRLYRLSTAYANLQPRLYQVPEGTSSFHPKAYIFAHGDHGVAFIGSSNLSRTALTHGIEWNLRTTSTDRATFAAIRARFEALFTAPQTAAVDPALIQAYRDALDAKHPHWRLPTPEPPPPLPKPHPIQAEVLEKLRQTRLPDNGAHTKGLVVMATGLGKTYLSAFDFQQMAKDPDHPVKRALFVAHREEILTQAATTWSKVFPDASIGLLVGKQNEPDADLVFASVQTLSRMHHLRGFQPRHFDYIVIDEFHHAAASSYRKLLNHFEPRFLLGLTATPDRMDGADLLRLCDYNLVARISLLEGISRELLVPFQYFGVKDSVDFAPIPWRGGRFDIDKLTKAVATTDRAQQAMDAYHAHAPHTDALPRRTLVFCCSQKHADFMAGYLNEHGVPAASVHSGPTSDPRQGSLDRLRAGTLEAICAVDVFNEGVDLPDVNTILMLRPTESPIIFLQQLGRGLRKPRDTAKTHLRVIDFIGNHRSFLAKPVALLALTGRDASSFAAVREILTGDIDKHLPPGCKLTIETEALDLLEKLAKFSKEDHLLYVYMQLRSQLSGRPTASEVFDAGASLRAVKKNYGTWFDFLDKQQDLTADEAEVLKTYCTWFQDLSDTRMTKSYKMVTLEVLHDQEALHASHDAMAIEDLAALCRARLDEDPVLRVEFTEHRDKSRADFAAKWRQMPLMIFHEGKSFKQPWFKVDGDRFVSLLDVAEEHRAVFDAMTMELVAFRLAQHRTKHTTIDKVLPLNAPIELRVGHARSQPILRLDRMRRPDIPTGDVTVLVEGTPFIFRFGPTAVRTVTERPGGTNVLQTLMTRWFGPTAGLPTTRHIVDLTKNHQADTWALTKREQYDELPTVIPFGAVPYYEDLMVACGLAQGQYEDHDRQTHLAVETHRPLNPTRHFVVRAHGDSMNGGAMPIADGDLVLCETLEATHADQVEGQVVLVAGASVDGEVLAYLKMPAQERGTWVLRSTNPSHPDISLDPHTKLTIRARAIDVVEERRGLQLWGLYSRPEIAESFGYEGNEGKWNQGHVDLEDMEPPQTILTVTLRKRNDAKKEHRYADRFLSPTEFQWESQARTSATGKQGQRVIAPEDGRAIHLFVRYLRLSSSGQGEEFVYCGVVRPMRFESSNPVRVWFELDAPMPNVLYRAWS